MSNRTDNQIKIDISISIPCDVAQEQIESIKQLVVALKAPVASLPKNNDLLIPDPSSSIPVLNEEHPIAQGMMYANQKAYEQKLAEEKEIAEKNERNKAHTIEIENNKKKFLKQAIQAYRSYRQIQHEYSRVNDCCKVVGQKYGWSGPLTLSIVSNRRQKVKAYIVKRRSNQIIRLRNKKWAINRIAEKVGVCTATVNNTLKKYPDLVKYRRKKRNKLAGRVK